MNIAPISYKTNFRGSNYTQNTNPIEHGSTINTEREMQIAELNKKIRDTELEKQRELNKLEDRLAYIQYKKDCLADFTRTFYDSISFDQGLKFASDYRDTMREFERIFDEMATKVYHYERLLENLKSKLQKLMNNNHK